MNKNLDELDLKTLHDELQDSLNCSEQDLDEAIFDKSILTCKIINVLPTSKDAGAVESMMILFRKMD